MKKSTFLLSAAAAVVLLAGSPSAKAVSPMLGLVTPGDTFTFDYSGFNSAGTSGFILGGGTATFGGTTTLATGGVNGQSISMTSAEVINGLTTTDTFTLTTPTNFITTAKVNGVTIAALQLDIGNANSGVIPGAANTVDYTLPVTGYTTAGTYTYSGGTAAFTTGPTPTLTNNSQSLALAAGINAGSAISAFAFTGISFSITYNTIPSVVPEPSTWAMCGVGLVGCAGVVFRRRRVG